MRRKELSSYEIGTPGHHGELEVPRGVRERGRNTLARDTGVARREPTMGLLPSPILHPPALSHTHSSDQLRAVSRVSGLDSCKEKGRRSRRGALPGLDPCWWQRLWAEVQGAGPGCPTLLGNSPFLSPGPHH